MKIYQVHLILLALLAGIAAFPLARAAMQRTWFRCSGTPAFRYALLAGAFCLSVLMSVLQTLALDFGGWDQGIFHQVLYSLGHGEGFHYTLENNSSYLSTHFSPYLILIAPFFRIFQSSPFFLAVLCPTLIWGGVLAWVKIAEIAEPNLAHEKDKPHGELATLTVLFALFFDSFWTNIRWGFHETNVYFAALSWFFYFWQRKKMIPALTLAFICCLTKETAWLDIASLALVISTSPRLRKKSYWVSAVCLAFFIAIYLFRPTQSGGENWISVLYGYLGGNHLSEIVFHSIAHPWQSVTAVQNNIGWQVVLGFWASLFLCFAFAPKGRILWSLVPSLLLYGLAFKSTLRDMHYHYCLTLYSVLFYASLERFKTWPLVRYAWALIPFLWTWFSPLTYSLHEWREAMVKPALRSTLRAIPEEDSVFIDQAYGAYIAARPEIYMFPEFVASGHACPKWIVSQQAEILARCGAYRKVDQIGNFQFFQK